MQPVYLHFICGCIGAIAPEIMRQYKIATEGGASRFSGFYISVSLVYALLGGLIATLLPSANPLAALYAGIGTPLIINTALKQAGPAPVAGPVATGNLPVGNKAFGNKTTAEGIHPVQARRRSRFEIFTYAL